MRNNPMAKAAKAKGTPTQGNNYPMANMPANNVGEFHTKVGAGQKSKFGQGVTPSSKQGASKQGDSKGANMPAKNGPDNKVRVGHTKHGVGEVPGYLKSY